MRAEDATPLALVLTELATNAVEHGLPDGRGTVEIDAQRGVDAEGAPVLRVTVGDHGEGLPESFNPGRSGLGTQIVQELVRELRGRIAWGPRPGGGTLVELELRPRPVGPA